MLKNINKFLMVAFISLLFGSLSSPITVLKAQSQDKPIDETPAEKGPETIKADATLDQCIKTLNGFTVVVSVSDPELKDFAIKMLSEHMGFITEAMLSDGQTLLLEWTNFSMMYFVPYPIEILELLSTLDSYHGIQTWCAYADGTLAPSVIGGNGVDDAFILRNLEL